ncbi:MAG: SMC-Scp complex subunit ScpB [Bacillota bacterium]
MSLSHLAYLEALLFVAPEPLSVARLASVLELSEEEIEALISRLTQTYRERNSGLTVLRVAGGYRLYTVPECAEVLDRLALPDEPMPLSRAALETLAVIAYRQPVTRAEIESLRGVKVDRALQTLIDRKLVQELGRQRGPGRPIIYGTTDRFLEHFGLDNLSDLPELEDVDHSLDEVAVTDIGALTSQEKDEAEPDPDPGSPAHCN